MSFWLRRYSKIKRKRHRAHPVDFFSVLKTYKTVLVHPVMEPGREVFSLNAVEDIIAHKGLEHVHLLLDEKLAFFFKNIPSKKIVYNGFSSPFAAPYKELRRQLSGKSYDVYVELNQFHEDIMTLFGIIIASKVQMCIDGSRENPVFNMVIAAEKHYSDLERHNLILKPLGISKMRKKIKWKKPAAQKKRKKAVAVAPANDGLGLQWYHSLKKRGLEPVLFVADSKKREKLKQKGGVNIMCMYPLEKAYDICATCSSFVVTRNPIFSIAYLLQRKTLLIAEKGEVVFPPEGSPIEIFSPEKDSGSVSTRLKSFTESM